MRLSLNCEGLNGIVSAASNARRIRSDVDRKRSRSDELRAIPDHVTSRDLRASGLTLVGGREWRRRTTWTMVCERANHLDRQRWIISKVDLQSTITWSDLKHLLLADIANKRFRPLRSMLPFRGLSVCYVRALCLNGRRHRRDFFCIRQFNVCPRSH